MNLLAAKTFLVGLGEVFAFWKKTQKADSLISYTQTTRVEPIAIVDERVLYVSYLNDVMQTALSLFAGWYLQAAAISCNVGKVNVGKFLGHLNPERSVLESHNDALEYVRGAALEANKDFRFGLPSTTRPALESMPATLRTAIEGEPSFDAERFLHDAKVKAAIINDGAEQLGNAFKEGDAKGSAGPTPFTSSDKGSSQGTGYDLNKDIKEAANLAVGRLYNVEISNDGHKASIPVMIRLLSHRVAPELLLHILSDGARLRTSSSKERWFGYQLGELKFWRDIVACSDLIREHKKALLADKSGVYNAIMARRTQNAAAFAATREPSVGTASNIAVVSRQTIRELEKEVGGKFDTFHVREKIFEMSELIMVIVIDAADDHVTYYHRGIQVATELTASQVKSSNKGSGPDVSDILKAFTLGQSPAASF